MKLFMILLGGRPEGRWTEQHDIFFGIGEDLKSLLSQIKSSWKETSRIGRLHIDAWREVTFANGYEVSVKPREDNTENKSVHLFFINLGGYKPGQFDEFHYKIVIAAASKAEAIKKAKQTTFYTEFDMQGANSHIDDKYGVDVDEIYAIEDILPQDLKDKYTIVLRPSSAIVEDEMHLGYLKLSSLR